MRSLSRSSSCFEPVLPLGFTLVLLEQRTTEKPASKQSPQDAFIIGRNSSGPFISLVSRQVLR
jgi:hypothetical protein